MDNPTRLRIFILDTGTHPPERPQEEPGFDLTASPSHSGDFAHVCTNVGVADSVTCECGAEEQTICHVVLLCPIHQPPHRLHGLKVPDNETIERLLHPCPEILCSQSVVSTTGSKIEENV